MISKRRNYLAILPEPNRRLPLTDYFIYSSHNTYLSGNQLTSDSKAERYIEDLENGVKCVEIDVHDSGDIPIVTHAVKGLYLNKAVSFEDVIREISLFCARNKGFDPIILSVENHCCPENKYKMVDIFFKYLKKYLYTIEDEIELKARTLEALRNKVIVKTDSRLKTVLDSKRKTAEDVGQRIKFALMPGSRQFPSAHFTDRFSEFEKYSQTMQKRKKAYLN
jgi:hypothetical protein